MKRNDVQLLMAQREKELLLSKRLYAEMRLKTDEMKFIQENETIIQIRSGLPLVIFLS
jgi:hypothetical protein